MCIESPRAAQRRKANGRPAIDCVACPYEPPVAASKLIALSARMGMDFAIAVPFGMPTPAGRASCARGGFSAGVGMAPEHR